MLWQAALPVEVLAAWSSAAVPDMVPEHSLSGSEPTWNLSRDESAAGSTQLLVCPHHATCCGLLFPCGLRIVKRDKNGWPYHCYLCPCMSARADLFDSFSSLFFLLQSAEHGGYHITKKTEVRLRAQNAEKLVR